MKKKVSIFYIFLACYVLLMLICSWRFLRYTTSCLEEYEASRPDLAMAQEMDEFKSLVQSGALAESIELPDTTLRFETHEAIKNGYIEQLRGAKSLDYARAKDSYNTEEPIYDIFADGKLVAKMTLEAINPKVILGILTVTQWQIKDISPIIMVNTESYEILAPKSVTVSISDIQLTADDIISEGNLLNLPEDVLTFVGEAGLWNRYKVDGLVNSPKVKVWEQEDRPLQPTVEGNLITIDYGFEEDAEMIKEEAYKLVRVWHDYVSDLNTEENNLANCRKYLFKDSYYWKLAGNYKDKWTLSEHLAEENVYENIELSEPKRISGNCYSCHVYFEKTMHLYKTDQYAKDVFDGTAYIAKDEKDKIFKLITIQ